MWEEWLIHHAGLVVRDINQTMDYYQSMGWQDKKQVVTVDNEYKIGVLRKGDLSLDFIQPISTTSRQAEFLRAHGEGIDHASFIVSDLEKEKMNMAAKGLWYLPAFENANYPEETEDYDMALFDTRQGGTIMIEMCQPKNHKAASSEAPPADGWIFDHLAYVVNDALTSLTFYASLGFEVQTRLKPMKKGLPLAVFIRHGGEQTLMIHDHNQWNQAKRFYDTHGEGIDHIGFNVRNIEEESEKIIQMGFPLLGNKILKGPDAARAFFDTRKFGGVILELAQPSMSLWGW